MSIACFFFALLCCVVGHGLLITCDMNDAVFRVLASMPFLITGIVVQKQIGKNKS